MKSFHNSYNYYCDNQRTTRNLREKSFACKIVYKMFSYFQKIFLYKYLMLINLTFLKTKTLFELYFQIEFTEIKYQHISFILTNKLRFNSTFSL